VEKKHNPISSEEFFYKIEMDTIQSSLQLFQRGIFGELMENKGKGMFPKMSTKTRFTLSSRSTCTLVGRSKNNKQLKWKLSKKVRRH
jgi:hypothetical protein